MRCYASKVIGVPADLVWTAVRDFNGLPVWHPAIVASEIEDGGDPARVGCVRRLRLADGGEVRERLVALDDVDRSYVYEFEASPFKVRSYRATIHVLSVTQDDSSFVEWHAEFDADAADEQELADTFAHGVYRTGLDGLAAHLSG